MKSNEVMYDIPDLEQLREVLKSGKIAVFKDLGKFYLKYNIIQFKPVKELKDAVWNWHFNDLGTIPKDKERLIDDLKSEKIMVFEGNLKVMPQNRTEIMNDLLAGKKIVLEGFGKVYIAFHPSFTRWHDFHGEQSVPAKPYLNFLVDISFGTSVVRPTE